MQEGFRHRNEKEEHSICLLQGGSKWSPVDSSAGEIFRTRLLLALAQIYAQVDLFASLHQFYALLMHCKQLMEIIIMLKRIT